MLGALAGIVGAWQASEALKLLLGIGEPLAGRLMLVDTLQARVREVRFERDPQLRALRRRRRRSRDRIGNLRRRAEDSSVAEIDAEALDEALSRRGLLDVREPHEAVLGSIEGALRIPASELEGRMHELDSAARYVVACRVGAKSLWAVRRLQEAGFSRITHLRGGLLAYAARHHEFEFF